MTRRALLHSYMKQRKYDEAATLAHAGAMALLRAQQAGSGGDVALQFVEALSSGGMAVTLEQGGME